MKNKLIVLSGLVLASTPVVALAQAGGVGKFNRCTGSGTVTDIETLICKIGDILNSIVPILIALGVVYFVWGVVQYILSGDEEAKKGGRNKIISGIIGLAVIVGLWGLVRILTNTFDIENEGERIIYPTTPY
jgi:hypothetical protein